eukprot:gene10506-3028_t
MEEIEKQQPKENTLFVGGISWKATEEDLSKVFSKFGEVVEVKIVTDKFNNNQSKGFGFVEFKEKEVYEKVKNLGYVQLFGKNMNVGSAFRGGSKKNQKHHQQPQVLPHQYIFYPPNNNLPHYQNGQQLYSNYNPYLNQQQIFYSPEYQAQLQQQFYQQFYQQQQLQNEKNNLSLQYHYSQPFQPSNNTNNSVDSKKSNFENKKKK